MRILKIAFLSLVIIIGSILVCYSKKEKCEYEQKLFQACELLKTNNQESIINGIDMLAEMKGLVPLTLIKSQWYEKNNPVILEHIACLFSKNELAWAYFNDDIIKSPEIYRADIRKIRESILLKYFPPKNK